MSKIKCPNCGEMFTVDESGYMAIVGQVRDAEFQKELNQREKLLNDVKANEIQLAKIEVTKELEKSLADSKQEIERLKGELGKTETEKTLAITQEVSKVKDIVATKEQEITKLKLEADTKKSATELQIKNIEETYKNRLSEKDEQISYYKDLKSKQSTKMIGETLEQHCEIAFNQIRHAGFQNAYFEKDNTTSDNTKGDYIFREATEGGIEFISIMFEMKNEMDSTDKKKKNEDFFKKLDEDRNKKKCEYAVLVSMLEADNEYYNSGIVDISHKYPKMYVIRPQFFIPMITLLRNAAKNTVKYREQVAIMESQNADISNFENEMNAFKDSFGKNVINAKKKYDEAIASIDKSIKELESVRAKLTTSAGHLDAANNKVDALSIKKITKNNPTMKAKFAELQNDKF